MVKILFINDSSSNPNWGDRAAAIAIKRMIVDLGGTIIGVITEDELRESRFFQDRVDKREAVDGTRSLRDWIKLFLPPAALKLREKLLARLKGGDGDEADPIPLTFEGFESQIERVLSDRVTFGGLFDAIVQADLVVIHGDGCMVGNGVIPRSELFLAYMIKKRFQKPVILINHTTDFSHPDLNRMAEAVYPLLDDVTYRDQTSAELCRDRWPGRYAADTAFQFAPADRAAWASLAGRPTYFDVWPDQASFDPGSPYICLGGSSIYSFAGPPTNIIDGFMALVRHLQTIYKGQIVLATSDWKDQVLLRPVARSLELPLVGLTIPVQQAVDIIGNAQAYVGGRWHSAIFALRGGVPVIPLSSKTFKMEALIGMAGLPVTAFNALDLSNEKEAIGGALRDLVKEDDKLRQRLRHWATQQAESSWDNLAFLKRFENAAA